MKDLVVMIVDDDPTVLYLHRAAAKRSKLSLDPIGLSGGPETLAFLVENDAPENKYIILLDINMPGMNGWDLMDTISSKHYADRVFFVIVTSSIDTRDKEKSSAYPNVIGFYEKPLGAEELLAAIGSHPMRTH